MTNTHTYLFLVDKGNVFYYKGTGAGDFQSQRYSNDEKSRKFTDNFWSEWEKNAGYENDDKIDFAFLTDDENFEPKIPEAYLQIKPTEFFDQRIIMKFMEKLEYNDLSLVFNGKEEKILKKPELGYDGPKRFFLIIQYPDKITCKKQISSDAYPLGAFFQDKTKAWGENK